MYPARLAVTIGAAVALVAGSAGGSFGADAAAAEETACVAEIEPNDLVSEAVTFEGERCISGALVEVGDVDVFVWQVREEDAADWSVELDGPSDSAAELTLTHVGDETGTELARVETSEEHQSAGTELSVEAGTYALTVRRPDPESPQMASDAGGYELRVARAVVAEPEETMAAEETARIVVVAAEEGPPTIGAGAAVELLLDTSGSMLERLGERTKLQVAKRTLTDLVDELPGGLPVALRTFKAEPRSCATVLRVPLEPLRRKAMKQTIRDLPARKGTRTPLAKGISKSAEDLATADGHRVLVVVTDGKEDCGGDPVAAVRAIADAGYTSTVHLIGYALPDDQALRDELAELALIGRGRLFEASDRASLVEALAGAATAPYLVFDEADEVVAQGVVGDEGVEVEAGTYRVEVLGDPPSTFEAVAVEAGAEVELPLDPSGEA